ncbi:hypothetical protein PVAP13_8NG170800 [Panicum virgatum]|uniref:No apical meristem-associated C-terminal domain-containing protein n=1 Tax=Panicum virgatum TaxID=38727 RepID=A0A8T0P8V3_PANVG|nr:hypothetical protein PVAP13_8NG170800 [Panicum virgatum]
MLTHHQGSGSKRGGNYHHDEDIQLCRSWSDITTDPITANDQPSKSYWARITDHFHDNKCFDSNRTAASLEKTMGGILKDCMRFQGFYDKIERRHPSGVPYTEHIKEAQARYAQCDSKSKSFAFIHCWLEVRHTKKFLSLQETMKQSKRPSTSDKRATPAEAEAEGNDGGQDSTLANSSMPPAKQD